MTKFPHDQFAKEYLQELLSPLGAVETSKDVTAQVREIDVFFQPTAVNPEYAQTMWLRMLGKGRVQQEAIAQLTALPVDNLLRTNALELLYNLQANLQANLATNPEGDEEDQELVMAIAPLFQQQLQAAQQQGLQQGIQQGLSQGVELGRQEQQRLILESFFRVRFGELDERITPFLSTLSTLPTTEFTMMLLSISMLTVDADGRQQAMRLLAENVLRMQANELGDMLPTVVTNLLELPVEDLRLLLERSPQLSTDELIILLGQRPE